MSTIEIIFLTVIGALSLRSYWRRKTAARRIKKVGDDLQKEKPHFRANPEDYPHLDAAWYDERERELRSLGFRLVGNLGMEGVHSYVRACSSSDGHECVGVYHLRFTGFRALTMRMIGFKEQYAIEATTSFNDGSIVTTTTVPKSSLLTAPKLLERIHIDPAASVRKVVMSHSERVAEILAERPDLEVIPVRNFEDLMALAQREEELKRAHHVANRGITREDLERLGGPENRGIAHRVYDEIEELREKEARRAGPELVAPRVIQKSSAVRAPGPRHPDPREARMQAASVRPVGGVILDAGSVPTDVERDESSRFGRFSRALAFGTCAAVLCAGLWYAVTAMTGYELGLIALVVGLAVGFAVRIGSRERGGWLYQTMAVGLTYLAIVSTYVPMLVESFRELPMEAAPIAEGTEGVEDPGVVPPPTPVEPTVALDKEIPTSLLYAVAIPIAILSPVLMVFEDFLGSLMWLMIIGFALFEAWKVNERGAGRVATRGQLDSQKKIGPTLP